MRYVIVQLVFLFLACNSNTGNKKPGAGSNLHTDSLIQTLAIKKDTFGSIDELVLSIRQKIKNNELIKKKGHPDMIAYYYPDKTIAYIHSNETGEFGRAEAEFFFQNNDLRYGEYREYFLLPDADPNTGKLKAEKIFYCPEDPIAKDSVTIFNEDVKFAKKGTYVLTKEDLPTRTEIAIRALEMKSSFIGK